MMDTGGSSRKQSGGKKKRGKKKPHQIVIFVGKAVTGHRVSSNRQEVPPTAVREAHLSAFTSAVSLVQVRANYGTGGHTRPVIKKVTFIHFPSVFRAISKKS